MRRFRIGKPEVMLNSIHRPFVLLENRLQHGHPAKLYSNPQTIIRCDEQSEVAGAFQAIEAGLAKGLHAAGFLSYELGYGFEPKLLPLTPPHRMLPLIWFGLFAAPSSLPQKLLDDDLASLGPAPPLEELWPALDRATYRNKFRQTLDFIAAGDVYQVNLTFPMRFRYGGDPFALYACLRARQPVAHSAVVALNDATILSVSPELFLHVEGRQVTTRPMKGTKSRGVTEQADLLAQQNLREDPKQRAENLMIVDLLRNDLSRVSELGSVKVPTLFHVETYPSLHTMTSTVTATLRPGVSPFETMRALFPCGSIVGAPKHRACELIRLLEDHPRGVYTGAIGSFAPDGGSELSVAIRTAVISSDGKGTYGIGGGIVADSKPDSEYDECLLKAKVLTELAADYSLIETLRYSPQNGFTRLALHLERLERSAALLGFSFDRGDANRELARQLKFAESDQRVRLQLNRNGTLAISREPLSAEVRVPMNVAIAGHRIDCADPFLRHKTTCRQMYDQAYSAALASGNDEVLFLNQHGLVAETSRNTVFAQFGKILATPPIASGVLPGVLRQQMLQQGKAVERDFTLDDLRQADCWFLGNSLRGLRIARLKLRDIVVLPVTELSRSQGLHEACSNPDQSVELISGRL